MYAVIARVIAAVLVFLQQTYYWTGDDDSNNPSTAALQDLRITGLILARSGSKGILNKNLQDLNGHPLIHWSLTAMIESGVFHEIWVSTDNPAIKHYAMKLGVHVHDRAAYTATDEATSLVAVQEFLEKHPAVHNIGLVQCTSPFILPDYLTEASERLASGKCDSIFSVTRSHQLRWSVDVDESFVSRPLNFDPRYRPRRQDWQGEFVENGMFYFVRRSIVEKGALQGTRSCVVEIFKKNSLEIDTPEDLKVARVLITDWKRAPLRSTRTEL